MYKTNISILAITPGRNRIGVAVFRNGNLIYYCGKSLAQHRSMSEARKAINIIINRFADKYDINYLAMMKLNKQQRTSQAVVSIYEYVKTIAKRQHVVICESDPLLVRRLLCGESKPTNANTARRIASRYPELTRYLYENRHWGRRYYGFVFNALAVGDVWARDLATSQPWPRQFESTKGTIHGK